MRKYESRRSKEGVEKLKGERKRRENNKQKREKEGEIRKNK